MFYLIPPHYKGRVSGLWVHSNVWWWTRGKHTSSATYRRPDWWAMIMSSTNAKPDEGDGSVPNCRWLPQQNADTHKLLSDQGVAWPWDVEGNEDMKEEIRGLRHKTLETTTILLRRPKQTPHSRQPAWRLMYRWKELCQQCFCCVQGRAFRPS